MKTPKKKKSKKIKVKKPLELLEDPDEIKVPVKEKIKRRAKRTVPRK